ncbi:hypothetical protein SBOR_3588 [Sclerotinia borealis F-4128]|uniref:SET domain-containing protein n=1 Tax=Sclerotinia borealis (strain F-4128) TaxID=1432307 RepID=W9CNC7_SCLBF|nr:hypothetical protein SBOR_3588 [Sclerotinia borealis F-4128]
MSNWFSWPPWGRQSLEPGPDSLRPPPRSRAPSRSRRPSSRRLSAAERAARETEEKRAREVEEQRVASMSIAARLAYKEKIRFREEQKIRAVKERFLAEKKLIGQQHQAGLTEPNRAWKRKHDDDAEAQAAERRQAFIDAREAREQQASQPEWPAIQREANKTHAVKLFESIYVDLQNHFLHPTLINSERYNPYNEMFQSFHNAAHESLRRFVSLARNPEEGMGGIGIDSAAVLMLSESFRSALKYGEDRNGFLAQNGNAEFPLIGRWEEFEIKLRLEHTSIRGFAIARHIPYMTVYRRAAQEIFGGFNHVADQNLRLDPSIRNPFEVYLASDGRLLPCLFTPLPGHVEPTHQDIIIKHPFKNPKENESNKDNVGPAHQGVVTLPFQNLRENIYSRENFRGYAPPSSWPPSWEYPPADIQHPCLDWGKDYPVCVACGHRTGPSGAPEDADASGEKQICECKTPSVFDKILIEIREFPSTTTSKQLDRGIRSLQKIHKGHVIGEILGEFVPLGAELDFQCPHDFAIDFNGPPAVDKFGKVLEIDPDTIVTKPIDTNTDPIATLITGHKGSWTRLINNGSSRTANVEARSEVWAGKLRVTVRALRDIRFGEQLQIHYADIYLEPDGQSLNARKKEHRERLPMRGLSGFFK